MQASQLNKIVNLTPHSINLRVNSFLTREDMLNRVNETEIEVVYESQGVARVDVTSERVKTLDLSNDPNEKKFPFFQLPVLGNQYGAITGLPDTCEDDEYFVVSSLVASRATQLDHPLALAGRLLVVDKAIRIEEGPEKGRIIGCRGFARI